jgi:hypothetical protein
VDGKRQLPFPRLRIRAVGLNACDSLSGILQEHHDVFNTVAVFFCPQTTLLFELRARAIIPNAFYNFAQCSPWHQVAMCKPAYPN